MGFPRIRALASSCVTLAAQAAIRFGGWLFRRAAALHGATARVDTHIRVIPPGHTEEEPDWAHAVYVTAGGKLYFVTPRSIDLAQMDPESDTRH